MDYASDPGTSGPMRRCRRIHEKLPAGYVSIEGEFAREHRDEVVSLARNLEACEKEEHPLQRIMAIEEQGDKLMITTTDIHLARYIGEALEDALIRATWISSTTKKSICCGCVGNVSWRRESMDQIRLKAARSLARRGTHSGGSGPIAASA